MSVFSWSGLFSRQVGVCVGALALASIGVSSACSGNKEPGPGEPDSGSEGSGGSGHEPPPYEGGGGAGPELATCGDSPGSSGDAFSKKALLGAAASCASWNTCQFFNAATELGFRVSSYAQDPTEKRRDSARQAWLAAMEAWAGTVPFQFGPIAGNVSDTYHGRSIGVLIHPWPAPNRCEISKQLVSEFYVENGFQRVPPGARGLYALEYLLFSDAEETGCPAQSSVTKDWQALSADDRAKKKLAYAKAVADDVYRRAEELQQVWVKSGEDFTETLVNHRGYGSQNEALTIVAWSLLYIYEEVRDKKIGPLAGKGSTAPNPETPFAQVDIELIRKNVQAFKQLFQGCGPDGVGLGFDDWLTEANATELRDDLLLAFNKIEVRVADFPSLHEASEGELSELYEDLKGLSDLLKGPLIGSGSPLGIKLPASAASDTD